MCGAFRGTLVSLTMQAPWRYIVLTTVLAANLVGMSDPARKCHDRAGQHDPLSTIFTRLPILSLIGAVIDTHQRRDHSCDALASHGASGADPGRGSTIRV